MLRAVFALDDGEKYTLPIVNKMVEFVSKKLCKVVEVEVWEGDKRTLYHAINVTMFPGYKLRWTF